MADRPGVSQVFEFGVEGTAGTEALRRRLLRAQRWTLTPMATTDSLRSAGFKYLTATWENQEWASGTFTGPFDFNEAAYVLASVIETPAITVAGTAAAGTAYQYIYESDSDGLDTYTSYTAAYGDANHAEKCTFLVVPSITLEIGRDAVTFSGQGIAQRVTAGTITVSGTAAFLTEAQTVTATRIAVPGNWSLYMDDTAGSIGNTLLTRDYAATFTLSNRYTPQWVVNAANPSWVTLLEAPAELGLSLTLAADSVARDLLTTLRNGATKYVRLRAVGGTLTGGTSLSYTATIDMAVQVTSAPSAAETQDAFTWQWGFSGVHDGTLGYAYRVTLLNALPAL